MADNTGLLWRLVSILSLNMLLKRTIGGSEGNSSEGRGGVLCVLMLAVAITFPFMCSRIRGIDKFLHHLVAHRNVLVQVVEI